MQHPLFYVFLIVGALGGAYHCFDGIRSAIHGTQPQGSAPDKDPQSVSTRIGGFIGAAATGVISVICFYILLTGG